MTLAAVVTADENALVGFPPAGGLLPDTGESGGLIQAT